MLPNNSSVPSSLLVNWQVFLIVTEGKTMDTKLFFALGLLGSYNLFFSSQLSDLPLS